MSTFRPVSIDLIIINREGRQRRELTGLEELAESIRRSGLINPIVVTEDFVLVAGERRFTACRNILGWTSIDAHFVSDLSEDELHLIELEENVRREELPWQDRCLAVESYYQLRVNTNPDWSLTDTCEALGMHRKMISAYRGVAQALIAEDPAVMSADKYSVARGLVERRQQRVRESEAGSILKPSNPNIILTPKNDIPPKQGYNPEGDMRAMVMYEQTLPFQHCDFHVWAASYSGPKFNFIHCDFPYGINADKHNMGAADAHGGYDDSEDVYWELLDTLKDAMANVIADSAHMIFWYSMKFHDPTEALLEDMGWTVNPFPLIWHKSDSSILPDAKRGPRRQYETAFLCTRGDRYIVRAVQNIYTHAGTKEIHMSEKPRPMLEYFMSMLVDDTTTMLDPTMGSGNAVVVAEKLGAVRALGLERDPEFFKLSSAAYIKRLQQAGE